ncbi:hypothetical protein [Rhodoferax aquaticus]|uniref:Uncharacterized protein n=1 Tax=Rhodoferax aquaticus TaxID=2527691 RepID=A0A515ESG5_9BURK|nr:hypothetical protein [Rhodoferax aquaticus]QDL55568.1 hypothetical protein EXZ61_16060 [Rhodoferax aquaticus]
MTHHFELEQQTHAALAQYYRWYQVYEVPFTPARIANQKDILSDDIEIISQMGTSKGKAGLEDRLKVFAGWKNAHHVQNTQVRRTAQGQLQLEADIVYQNIRPDDSKFSYTLHYSTLLSPRAQDLPVFERLELTPTGEVKEFKFEPAYAQNRARSLMHYWLYLVETSHQDSGKFLEILAPNFALQLSDQTRISTLAQLTQWLASIPSRIQSSTHAYKNLQVTALSDGTIRVSVDFDWRGINLVGQQMVGATHHEWLLINNMDERFARIQSMQVTMLTPFQLAP